MKSFRFLLFPVLLAAFVLLAGPVSVKAAAAKSSPAAQVLDIAVDKGIPLTLGAPAASVFIANPEIADVQVMSPTSVMVFGKKTGQTTLMATDNYGQTLLFRTIMVRQNLEDLRQALNAVIPGNKIGVEAVPNGIVLTGQAKDPGAVEDARRLAMRYVPKEGGEVINRIKVRGSNQIQIRVRFAEVSRDVDKRFGIDWESLGTIGGFAFGLMSGNAPRVISSGANLLDRTRPTTGTNTNNIISFSSQGKNYNLNGLIDALAAEGFITVPAEPNLTPMSGETASFLAGGEFPVPVPQGLNTITIEWKTFGVSLAFTPTLVGEDRINLHVRPEVSQLSDAGAVTLNNITVPALTTRRAETTIELAGGQSFAIGGLLNNNQTQTVNKYPFLGDMPILGPLFRSTRFQNNQSELVIIITPYVVKPAQEEQLGLPTDGFSPPSDVDRIFRNRISNSDPAARPMSGTSRAVLAGPRESEEPIPVAAPIEPVLHETKDAMEPAPQQRMSLPAPVSPVAPSGASETSRPAGPSGFIVE
ncbi:MAG: pilus assembly protein N-terminal domain-containing protein [Alphaproteobacteria bacterium]|nr:pilus assembly protein N-terminal domain-containing protein [Alphaproteobacteria bacterium]